jgi:hypothetical protein
MTDTPKDSHPTGPDPSITPSKAARMREWIDVIAYGGRTLMAGVIPLGLGTLGGLEYLDPSLLPSVHMSSDFALTLFSGACTFYGLPIFQNHLSRRPPE